MRSWLLIPLLLFLLNACKGKNNIPDGVLSQKKMQAVLWDMMRADQFLLANVLSKDTSLDKVAESFKYYRQIFTIHNTNQEQFKKSFSFYKDHPGLLKVIMDSLSQAPLAAPTQPVTAPTPPVQPIVTPEIIQPTPQQTLPDTIIRVQKKKPLSVE